MRFALSAEQAQVRDLVRDLLAAECPAPVVRAGWSGERAGIGRVWTMLAESGVTGLLVAAEHGGLALDEVYLVAVLTEAGYAGLPGPLVETVAGAALGPALPAGALDAVLAGTGRIAVDEDDDGLVAHTAGATVLLRGGWAGRTPVRVAEVSRFSSSDLEPVEAIDRTRDLARCRVAGHPVGLSAGELTAFWHRGVLGTAATLTGLARRLLDLTVAYVTERRQFGVPIGSFQAVKHHLAELKLAVELAAPAVLRAANSLATGDREVARHVSMAKVLAGQAAARAATTSIQCHGAMGYTEESDVHLFAKRALALAGAWGSTGWHRRAVADDLIPAKES